MNCLLALLIVAANQAAPTHTHSTGAVEVYRCDFEQSSDANYDHWPDNWRRQSGRGFPHFVKIGISGDNEQSAAADGQVFAGSRAEDRPAGRHLRIDLNGGAASAYSPQISVSPLFSYVFTGFLRTEGLKHDSAFYTIDFFDAQGQIVDRRVSHRLRNAGDWTKVTIGSILYVNPQAKSVRIGLHLHPGEEQDLFGAALFDNVLLARLPRMTVAASQPHHLYSRSDRVEIICDISGIPDRHPTLRFELVDMAGSVVDQWEHSPYLNAESHGQSPDDGDAQIGASTAKVGYAGAVSWTPLANDLQRRAELMRPGYYRVNVALKGSDSLDLQRETALAIIEPFELVEGGDIGWALASAEALPDVKSLFTLLPQVGINWVKYPVWYGKDEIDKAEELVWFAERMQTSGIEMIGVLGQPPDDVRASFGDRESIPVASVFVEPELWKPALEPVMTRLSQIVRWWQLGDDNDTSFVDFPGMSDKLRQIKAETAMFGHAIDVGLTWNWLHELPRVQSGLRSSGSSAAAYDFLTFSAQLPLTAEELANNLEGFGDHPARKWITLKPLAEANYRTEDRVRDLVMRMAAAKINGADVVFVANPFSPEEGLLNKDGSPGPLFLPFRTTAQMLSGARYEGSLTLPEGSSNYVFSRDGEAIMMVWNEKPQQEAIYLGDEIRQTDLWGRSTAARNDGEHERVKQIIEVGPSPTFVRGAHLQIARWRMGVHFASDELPNIFGRPQTVECKLTNPFSRGLGGRVTLHAPNEWRARQSTLEFELPPDGAQSRAFQVLLRADASTGAQKVRLDFDISADRDYKFSVFRTLRVGGGEVHVELTTRLAPEGHLIVEQQMTNNSDESVSFNCLLSAPQRRRLRKQVVNLRRGASTTVYYFPNGRELIGKTIWLRANEIRGDRILNVHVTAK